MDDDGGILRQQLERSRRLGFLGPGPVDEHIEQARVLAKTIELSAMGARIGDGSLLDLGSGGGIPGLVLLAEMSWSRVVLLDRSERRCEFLRSAVTALRAVPPGATEGDSEEADVSVVCGSAESLAHQPDLRGQFDLVVARGFGPPATTAECGVGFLGLGGHLLVTDPPGGRIWERLGLLKLGLELVEHSTGRPAWTLLERTGELSEDIPRPEGRTRRRPLF